MRKIWLAKLGRQVEWKKTHLCPIFEEKSTIKNVLVETVSDVGKIQFHGKMFTVMGESNSVYTGNNSEAERMCSNRGAKLASVHYWEEFHL